MQPAIFLDRDGVIIENRPDYVRSWADVTFLPGALATLARVSQLPYQIVVVTNQSAVGRGLIPLSTAQAINRRLVEVVERASGRIDRVYMCPHAPGEGCDCRKPEPGMFLQAAREMSLDLSQSIMVGDALTDLDAARAAGVPYVALVRTGRGAEQAALPAASRLQPFPLHDTLAGALAGILESAGERYS